MKMLKPTLLLSFILTVCSGQKGCKISIDYETGDLRDPQPLILNSSYEILHPDKTGILAFSRGQPILLACPGKNNGFNVPLKSQQIIEASCVQSKQFKVDGKSYLFNLFTCKGNLKTVVKKRGSCLDNFSKIQIGYKVSETFIPVIEICRDDTTDESYYAKSKMSRSIGGSQHNSPRPGWISQNMFHGNNIDAFYKKKHQLEILGMILNSKELAQKYMKKNQLIRGHLAPKGDYVYGSEQNSTFSFANAAPQWSSFNGGNWKHIEIAARNFVVDNDLKVMIYTGVHGQITLRDDKNEKQPIYLNIDENYNKYIRVPKFFWKIIYDPVRRLALAIIGVNDPFSKEITKDMFLCQDISDNPNVAWLTKSWNNRMEISRGVSYVCQYEELKKAVHTVPDLKVKGVLRN